MATITITQEDIDNSPYLQSQGAVPGQEWTDNSDLGIEDEDDADSTYGNVEEIPDELPKIDRGEEESWEPFTYDIDMFNEMYQSGDYNTNDLVEQMITDSKSGKVILRNGDVLDVKRLKQSGVDPVDIAATLAKGGTFKEFDNLYQATIGGLNTGIADFIGMPVDLMTGGLNLIPGVDIDNPVGGSQSIKALMEKAGIDTVGNVQEVVPTQRGNVMGGQIFGSSVSFMIPLGALASGGKYSMDLITRNPWMAGLIEGIKKNPGTYKNVKGINLPTSLGNYGRELSAVTSASTVGGSFQDFFPESEIMAPFVGELIGGFANPMGYLKEGGGAFLKTMSKFFLNFTDAGKQINAAKALKEILADTGEDPEEIIKALDNVIKDPKSGDKLVTGQTSGQITKSIGLNQLEMELAKQRPTFSLQRDQAYTSTMNVLKDAITRLAQSGDPKNVKIAAKLEQQVLLRQVDEEFADLNAAFKASKGNIDVKGMGFKSTSDAKRQSSLVTSEKILQSIKQFRATESALWDKIDRDLIPNTGRTETAIEKVQDSFMDDLGEPGLPEWIVNFKLKARGELDDGAEEVTDKVPESEVVKPYADKNAFDNLEATQDFDEGGDLAEEINIDYMLKLRTRLLSTARNLRSGLNPNKDLARKYEEIASAVLEDLKNLGRRGKDGKVVNETDAKVLEDIENAVGYSKNLNDNIIRSEVADTVLLKSADYRPGTDSEQTLSELTSGGGKGDPTISRELNLEKINEIETKIKDEEQLTKDLEVKPLEDGVESINTSAEQETFMKALANKVFNNKTGEVDTNALANFLTDNEIILNKFPKLAQDLKDLSNNQDKLTQKVKEMKNNPDKTLGNEALAKILNTDNPSKAILEMLQGGQPRTNLDRVIEIVNKSGSKKALVGLKNAILDGLRTNAITPSGEFNLQKFITNLLTPDKLATGGESLFDYMKKNKIFSSPGEASRLKKVLKESLNMLVIARKGSYDVKDKFQEDSMLSNLLARWVGAAGGSSLPGGDGASLVLAGFGSRIAQKILEQLPNDGMGKILVEAARDPKLMKILLEKTVDQDKYIRTAQNLYAWLYSQGLVEIPDALENIGGEEDETDRMLRENESTPE